MVATANPVGRGALIKPVVHRQKTRLLKLSVTRMILDGTDLALASHAEFVPDAPRDGTGLAIDQRLQVNVFGARALYRAALLVAVAGREHDCGLDRVINDMDFAGEVRRGELCQARGKSFIGEGGCCREQRGGNRHRGQL